MKHLLVGCSFTDPLWQKVTPWSVAYSETQESYIIAKAAMGIKGIATEALSYTRDVVDEIDTAVIVLPTVHRLDQEMDQETYLCNAMVDLLHANQGIVKKDVVASRKWIVSGGVNFDNTTEQGKHYDFIYKHKGLLVNFKEQIMALLQLIDYFKLNNIKYHITAIQDPKEQFHGLEYIQDEAYKLLDMVEYDSWFKFDGKFIDKFLGHQDHPSDEEHKILNEYIQKIIIGE